jgi:acetyl esterase
MRSHDRGNDVPLHPQAQAFCDAINALGTPAPTDETVQEARAALSLLHAGGSGEPQPVYAIGELDADGVPVRVYRPSADDNLPVVVYFHGGGWTIGSVDDYDIVTRALANAAQAIVVSVEYRLAPENPYPVPLDDCWTAFEWVTKNTTLFEGDASRIAVAGDSAGGNIAAVIALMARDANLPLALQALIYPVTDASLSTPSHSENAEGYLLEETQMKWFVDCYTRGADASDWHISPLRAPEVAGVAPALVITAEFDVLRDEGEAYARRLADAGVPVEHTRYDGMIHAFWALPAVLEDGKRAMEQVAAALQKAFA